MKQKSDLCCLTNENNALRLKISLIPLALRVMMDKDVLTTTDVKSKVWMKLDFNLTVGS
jgi:hypothetical protein